MAHNSKRNRHHTTVQDGDDYVYPTKKMGNQTRNRKHDKSMIKAGLTDYENKKFDEFEQEGEDEINEPLYTLYEIEEMIEEFGTDDADEANTFDSLHDDLMEDYGQDWENY